LYTFAPSLEEAGGDWGDIRLYQIKEHPSKQEPYYVLQILFAAAGHIWTAAQGLLN